MATKYGKLTHDPKTCFICLGLRWNGSEWIPDDRVRDNSAR